MQGEEFGKRLIGVPQIKIPVGGKPIISPGGRFLAEDRELTVFVPNMVRYVIKYVTENGLPEYYKSLSSSTWTTSDELKVIDALREFMQEHSVITPKTLAEASGAQAFLKCPEPARTALMAFMGEVLLTSFWYCVRDTVFFMEGVSAGITHYDPKDFCREGCGLTKFLGKTKYKRWLLRKFDTIKSWFRRGDG